MARSGMPSPLKSAVVMNQVPLAILPEDLVVNVPSPLPSSTVNVW